MIYCIGDSFTAGDELTGWPTNFDCVNKPYPTHPDSWPYLLGQKLNQPVENLGRGGAGNTRIVKRAIDCVFEKPSLIVVAWSSPLRLEMVDDLSIFDFWQGRDSSRMPNEHTRKDIIKWITLHQNEESISKWYMAAWLRQIILLQSFFQTNNQRYIMTSSNPYREYLDYRKELENLYNKVDGTYFIEWDRGYSMQDWAYGYPKGPGGHFLEQGHQAVADKIYEHIRHFNWFS